MPALGDEPSTAQEKALVEVVPLGAVDRVALQVTAANLQAILELRADVAAAEERPDYALIQERGQYNAGPILKKLAEEAYPVPIRVGLTGVDLCLPILTFVYGEAQMGGRAAVVSYARLGWDESGFETELPVFYERLAKVIVHETAHVLGLAHCRVPGCLMRFSQTLEHLDELNLLFCDQCRYEIQRTVRAMERMIAEEEPG